MAMNPKIKEYFRRKGVLPAGYDDADQVVDDANQADANMGWAKVAGQMSDNFSNSSNQDIILKNKHSALGNQPNVIEAKKQRTDFSLADSLGQDRKGAAQAKLEQMKSDMRARLGGQQADEKLEFDRAEGAQKQSNFEAKMAQDERAMQSQVASRQAYADATMGLKREEIAAKRADNADPFKRLPKDNQETITELSKKNASKESIANQIDAMLVEADNTQDESAKLAIYRQMGKILNSTEGADAVGADEAKRLMSNLEFAMGNLFNNNPVQFGRDLPGFADQARATSTAVRNGQKANQSVIDQKYGRPVKMRDANGMIFNIPANEAAEAEADGLQRI